MTRRAPSRQSAAHPTHFVDGIAADKSRTFHTDRDFIAVRLGVENLISAPQTPKVDD